MTEKPYITLDLARFNYELALLQGPPDGATIIRPGYWVRLTDGMSEGDVLNLALAAGQGGGVEVELQVRDGRPVLVVYDWRHSPARKVKHSSDDHRRLDAVVDLPALRVYLDDMTIETNTPADQEALAAKFIAKDADPLGASP